MNKLNNQNISNQGIYKVYTRYLFYISYCLESVIISESAKLGKLNSEAYSKMLCQKFV